MNRFKHFLLTFLVMFAVVACNNSPTSAVAVLDNQTADAFDSLGYNEVAGIFNGPADGTDKKLDGMIWGDPTYANDHLVMKWNKAWVNCNESRSLETCDGAWINNEWNGQVEGGSGETWHYKIQWIGACGATGTPLLDGGYCIWNEYEVLMSQGTGDNQHFWDAHANPNGFGN
ncbi:MAG: hypothetical protein ACYCY6_00045 [Minisyncoccota bacterium]